MGLTVLVVPFIPKLYGIDQGRIAKSVPHLLDSDSDLEMIKNLQVVRVDLHDQAVVLEEQVQEELHDQVVVSEEQVVVSEEQVQEVLQEREEDLVEGLLLQLLLLSRRFNK